MTHPEILAAKHAAHNAAAVADEAERNDYKTSGTLSAHTLHLIELARVAHADLEYIRYKHMP